MELILNKDREVTINNESRYYNLIIHTIIKGDIDAWSSNLYIEFTYKDKRIEMLCPVDVEYDEEETFMRITQCIEKGLWCKGDKYFDDDMKKFKCYFLGYDNIDFNDAFIGYTAIDTENGYENRVILDEKKMAEIILQNKDRLDDVENEDDAYEYINEMQTQSWFMDEVILKYDYEPIG